MSKQGYLVLYNGVSCLVWTYIFSKCLIDLPQELATGMDESYIGFPHKVLVYSQIINSGLEIVHIILGLVKAPLVTTILQSMARLIITIGICMYLPQSPGNFDVWSFNGLTLAWSLTEVVRYGFYLIKLITIPPSWLLWLRYSTFIVLYPVGLICESTVVYKSVPFAASTFHKWLLIVTLLSYIPGFVTLYSYMFKQRKKMLGKVDQSSKFLEKNPKYR